MENYCVMDSIKTYFILTHNFSGGLVIRLRIAYLLAHSRWEIPETPKVTSEDDSPIHCNIKDWKVMVMGFSVSSSVLAGIQ